MNEGLRTSPGWNRARATLLHEHFRALAISLQTPGRKVTAEIERAAKLLNGRVIQWNGGEEVLNISAKRLLALWYSWLKGNPHPETGTLRGEPRTPEALLCHYKPGCGGKHAMPRELQREIQRRATHATGGRDKHGRSPLSVVFASLRRDFANRRPIPGIDYTLYPEGAEFPWSYESVNRKKPPRSIRLLGNVGISAHKAASAYTSMDYSKLRKGELYTLDDVRLDIFAIDEATGKGVEVVCYIFMEVASRYIVGFLMKPAAAIRQEDVDELVAHCLQVEGFGIGVGYPTHILFERGAVACSEAAQLVLEGATDGRVKVHRTGMNGGIRWIGSARDTATGNAAGKAVIESFNRKLHFALLSLPGQRGNLYANQPANIDATVKEAELLASFNIKYRTKLRLGLLYFCDLNRCVREAISLHNREAGRNYSGHGQFLEAEVQPGVWQDVASNQ